MDRNETRGGGGRKIQILSRIPETFGKKSVMAPAMKAFLSLLSIWTATALASAAGPSPELDTVVARKNTDQAALDGERATQTDAARNRYLQALSAARAEMQKAVRGGTVNAIDVEMADAKKEVHNPAVPSDLPRTLAPARREFLAALATIEKDFGTRQEDLRKRYQAELNRLAQWAATQKNQALTEAVTRELAAAGTPTQTPAPIATGLHRNMVINGRFSGGETGGVPNAWHPKGATFQGDRVPWQNDAVVLQEGSESFLRFRRAGSVRLANVSPTAEILVPEKSRVAVVTARVRVEGLVPGKDYDRFPGVFIRALDAGGKSPGSASAVATENTHWKRIAARLVLQPGARTLELAVGPAAAAGICDFTDVEVKFE